MLYEPGYLQAHPLPPGIVGALGIGGYQLLADVAGVGAGRLGPHVFLLVAPDPDPAVRRTPGTQIALHQSRLKDEADVAAFTQLAAQLGYLRLSGYRLTLERHGLRSKVGVLNPATGAIVATIPDKHPGGLLGGGNDAARLLAGVRSLPPAGAPPDLQNPELLRQVLLALALRDESVSGAEAAELADRALELTRGERRSGPAGRAGGGQKPLSISPNDLKLTGMRPIVAACPLMLSPRRLRRALISRPNGARYPFRQRSAPVADPGDPAGDRRRRR